VGGDQTACGLRLLQDSLADWAAALLFDKAAAAGAAATAAHKKAGKKAAAAAAAEEADDMDWQGPEATEGEEGAAATEAGAVAAAAFAELRQLLAAVAAVGRAAGACLGKLSAAMAAKKKLKAAAVACGLEAVIAGKNTCLLASVIVNSTRGRSDSYAGNMLLGCARQHSIGQPARQTNLTMRFCLRVPPHCTAAAGTPTGSSSALGAYILLKEIAAQDPAAPSWQFLQQRWAAVRASAAAAAAGAGGGPAADGQGAAASSAGLAEEAAALLLVISETAAGFPADQAQALAAELLQVRCRLLLRLLLVLLQPHCVSCGLHAKHAKQAGCANS
jgi:hypothetical protein